MGIKHWRGNLDGRSEALICAPTQKAAAELAGTSLRGFRDYFSRCDKPEASMVTDDRPGIWTRSYRLNVLGDPWAGWTFRAALAAETRAK